MSNRLAELRAILADVRARWTRRAHQAYASCNCPSRRSKERSSNAVPGKTCGMADGGHDGVTLVASGLVPRVSSGPVIDPPPPTEEF